MKNINEVFKPYIQSSKGYKGGKAISEVVTKADKIYKLSSNENLLGSSPKAMKAIQDSVHDMNIYPDGMPHRLQAALSEFYDGELAPEQFIIGNGGSEIIDLLIRSLMTEDTEAIVSNPCFSPYLMFSTWTGGSIIDVPLQLPDYSLDVDGILAKVSDKTRIIFCTSPNNPTGTHIAKADFERLLEGVPDHVLVVYDEVYFHFADAPDYVRAVDYVKKGHNIIAINSFSKTYGLAALRLGYAYSTPEITQYILKLGRPFYINSININAGIAALRDTEFVEQTATHVIAERKKLYAAFEKMGIHYWPSQANFVMWNSPTDRDEIIEALIYRGIMTRSAFGTESGIRVTVGTTEANDAFIAALQEILSA